MPQYIRKRHGINIMKHKAEFHSDSNFCQSAKLQETFLITHITCKGTI